MITRLTGYFFRRVIKDGDALNWVTMTLNTTEVFDIPVAIELCIHSLTTPFHRPRELHIKTSQNLRLNGIDIFPRIR